MKSLDHTPHLAFWNWFTEHQRELFDFEADQERMFDQLASQLQKVDSNLTFEFGPKREGRRDFVVSAGGIKTAFPAVVSLVDSAPTLARWRVIAFRPRRSPVNVVELNGKRVDPADVLFTLLDNGVIAGLHLFIPNFRETDADFKQIGYLLLDEALGEYDVESRVGLIKMLSLDDPAVGDQHALAELPVLFDRLVARLEGRTSRPS